MKRRHSKTIQNNALDKINNIVIQNIKTAL